MICPIFLVPLGCWSWSSSVGRLHCLRTIADDFPVFQMMAGFYHTVRLRITLRLFVQQAALRHPDEDFVLILVDSR
jgi:hypothetical protein